ncbi:MAG: hypothetical protein IPM51_03750 [Sphingobacteriaceae bacterium]|nr:hypothetical protein [Sphingobacteriaceae bacterium]
MRKILHILFIFLIYFNSGNLNAQGNKDKVEEMRVSFINKKLSLSANESQKFWPVYNEYNDKVKALRRNLRKNIRKAPENLSETEAEELYQLDIKTKQAEAELHSVYSEKIKTIIGAKKIIILRAAEEEFKQKVLDSIKGKE